MRVAFDSDGVLDTFGDGVHEALIARGLGHLWKSGPTKKSIWNFYEEWGWTFEQFKELVDWGVDHGYIFKGHWRPCAIESVARVARLGHEVIIITDRSWGSHPINSHAATIEAYARAGIEYDELHFTADKTSVPVDMMVEDKWENFSALLDKGVDAYLVTRAWNEQYNAGNRRIKCVSDFAEIVEAKTLSNVV